MKTLRQLAAENEFPFKVRLCDPDAIESYTAIITSFDRDSARYEGHSLGWTCESGFGLDSPLWDIVYDAELPKCELYLILNNKG